MTTSDSMLANPARLRSYRVRLYWPTLKRSTFLRLDAIDAWDANAFVRLNYDGAMPFGFEAWNEAVHGPELRQSMKHEQALLTASAIAADSPVVPTDGGIPEGPQG